MNNKEKKFVHNIFELVFFWMDMSDRQKLYDELEEDIISDIEETADPNGWNSEDVRIAIRRTIFLRLGIHQ